MRTLVDRLEPGELIPNGPFSYYGGKIMAYYRFTYLKHLSEICISFSCWFRLLRLRSENGRVTQHWYSLMSISLCFQF